MVVRFPSLVMTLPCLLCPSKESGGIGGEREALGEGGVRKLGSLFDWISPVLDSSLKCLLLLFAICP